MSRTKKIYFLSAFVLIIGCYALNLSYSLFTQTVTPENNTVDATVPYLSANLETNTFTIPANDSKVITLNIINSGTSDINYGISVSDTKGTIIQLVETYNITGKLNPSSIEGETTSKEVLVYVTNPTDTEITNLTFDLTTNYTTISFDEETFIASSNIDCENKVKLLKESLIARAESITENDSKINGYAMYSETLRTTPGESLSAVDESLLLMAEDDYTATTGNPSYYFRGNVEDNYVTFADMCWRVVRIAGDGSTKLILEDQYTTCDDLEDTDGEGTTDYAYTGNWNIGTGNYGYESKDVINSNIGNEYIMSYLKPVTNADKSMVKAFYDFQKDKLEDYKSKLKSGNWCLADKAYTQSGGFPNYTYTLLEEYNYSSIMYYDSYVRLNINSTKEPTLKCTGTIMDKFESVIYNETEIIEEAPMYVSALTADEIVYAGGKHAEGNSNYYLINNYQMSNSNYFWSLSPYAFDGNDDGPFYVINNGRLNGNPVSNDSAFRPSVSLASNVVVEVGGNGTQENPYVIK